jgi:hypothetical protein
MHARLNRLPEAMTTRQQTVEPQFVALKAWMGSTRFPTKTLDKVRTEMSFRLLPTNVKRMISVLGVKRPTQAIAA